MPGKLSRYEHDPLVLEPPPLPDPDSVEQILVNPGERFFIVIDVVSGGCQGVVVDDDQTVKQLKRAIEIKMPNLPAARQCVRLRGMLMEETWKIEDIPTGVTNLHVDLSSLAQAARATKLDVTQFLKDHDEMEYDEQSALGLKKEIQKLRKLQELVEHSSQAVKDTKFLFEDTKNDYVCEWMQDKSNQVASIGDEHNKLVQERKRIEMELRPAAGEEEEHRSTVITDGGRQEKEEQRRAKLRREVFALQVDKASDLFIEDLVIFVMFFIVFTFISFANRRFNAEFYYFTDQLTRSFETPSFLNISTEAGMWNYMEQEAVPLLTQDRWYNGDLMEPFSTGYVLLLSRLLGSFRLRQVRGSKEAASLGGLLPPAADTLLADFKYTYSSSDPSSEAITRGGITYEFQELDGIDVSGKFNSYPSSGFVANFSPSNTSGEVIRSHIHQMRLDHWTDEQTRGLLLEANLYNPNEDFYVTLKILFELPIIGSVKANPVKVDILRLNRYATPLDIVVLLFEVILFGIMVDFFRTIFKRIQLEGTEVFKQTWTWFDCVNLTTLWLVTALRISWLAMWLNTNVNSDEYVDLSLIGSVYYWDNTVNALNSLLINLRSFKFLALWSRMQVFKDTIKISVPQIMMYWSNIFIVMFAFAAAGFVAFGKHLGDYQDMGYALISQFKMASGQFDFKGLKSQDPFLGPLFLVSYAVLVYFCMTAMFMAINCHTYDLVIHNLHIPKNVQNIDGPKMIESVKRKIRDFIEEKIPYLRRKREAAANEVRAEELRLASENLSKDEQNEVIREFKELINLIGRDKVDELFSEDEFYAATITYQESYDSAFSRKEYNAILAKIKQANMEVDVLM